MSQPPAPRPVIAQKLSDEVAAAEAEAILQAAYGTSYRNDALLPVTGDSPPVPQPGRPPMSQGATDASVLMLAGGATTAMVGGTAATLMYVSQYADPVVCALVFGAPTVLVLAINRLLGRAKEVLPPEHHHHYEGPVYQDQRSIHTQTRGVIANTRNQMPS